MTIRHHPMVVTAHEADELAGRDIGRPYQHKVCRACGKHFRTCSGGRLDCLQCSPATLGRRMDPEVKESLRESKRMHFAGDIRDPLAPPEEVLRVQARLKGANLKPKTSTEAIGLLAEVMEYVAQGSLSALRGRILAMMITIQIRTIRDQERLVFQATLARNREARRRMAQSGIRRLKEKKRIRLAKERAKAKEERAKRLLALKKNSSAKAVERVPLPEMTDQDRRLAEGV